MEGKPNESIQKETQLTASDRLPYEKFLQKGAESLSDAELLAIMLRTGPNPGPDAPQAFRDCPALALAEQVLSCRSVPEADFWDFPAYLATSCSRSGESAK